MKPKTFFKNVLKTYLSQKLTTNNSDKYEFPPLKKGKELEIVIHVY